MQVLLLTVLIAVTNNVAGKLIPVDNKIFHYDGYQVLRTFPTTLEQYDALHELEEFGNVDFWSDLTFINIRPTDIMVSQNELGIFLALLAKYSIPHQILIADVEKIISEQRIVSAKRPKAPIFNWNDYYSLDDIQNFLKKLAEDYPNLASVQIIGRSYEDRDIALIKISTGGQGKRAVFIDGNIHAREWISPAVVTYIANELVTKSHQNLNLLTQYDFYIVPNVNVDGYEYSRTTQRLWRKTRSDHKERTGCIGVDANRNWSYKWGHPGASPEKCSETYHGPVKFSEPETDAIQKFILSTPVNWEYFLTLHNYGQYCLLPYGDGTLPDDFNELMRKGNAFANAIFGAYGTIYSVGNSREILYPTSGTSQDWAKGNAKIKYSFTLELRDQGTFGFLLPAEQIAITAEETWVGIKAMLLM